MQWLGLDWDEGPYFQSQRRRALRRGHRAAAGRRGGLRLRLHARGDGGQRARERGTNPPATTGTAATGAWSRCRAAWCGSGPPTPGRPPLTTWSAARSPSTTPRSRTSGCASPTATPSFSWPTSSTTPTWRITHVIRGEDHVTNTTKYVLLWEALGLRPTARLRPPAAAATTTPARSSPSAGTRWPWRTTGTRATCPRPCATTWPCSGWSPGDDREILTLDELVAEFRLEDVKSAGAIFDERKLQAVNAEYLRALPTAELVERAQAWLRGPMGAPGAAWCRSGPAPWPTSTP